jgi:hypothetical protein
MAAFSSPQRHGGPFPCCRATADFCVGKFDRAGLLKRYPATPTYQHLVLSALGENRHLPHNLHYGKRRKGFVKFSRRSPR